MWCVGKLNEDGTPAAGYEGTGKKPIVIKNETPKPKPDPAFKKKNRNKKKAADQGSAKTS